MTSIEICAGAGGQALGLERAGFRHEVLVEIDRNACKTLRVNRPKWNVVECDVRNFNASEFACIDLLAGGVPCPPFSIAGKQLGSEDNRDLFPEMLRLAEESRPKAIMIENVRGLFDDKFLPYRQSIVDALERYGYNCHWDLVNAADFLVPQNRVRSILVALLDEYDRYFSWPSINPFTPQTTVGEALYTEMSSHGWSGAADWAKNANTIAPTLVGGSKKHGGADLGPTRARQAWDELGIDGRSLSNTPPDSAFVGKPHLTVKMAAIIQGFPPDWVFVGGKTNAYKQVGNAFPPPVAEAFGNAILSALSKIKSTHLEKETQYAG